MDFLIHHMLRNSARRFPDKEALVHGGERLLYREVEQRVSGLAHGLREAGAGRGDRIGIYLDASVPQALSIFGVSRADGVYVPINGLLFPEQVAHIARDCQMTGLITTREKLEALSPVLKEIPSLQFLVLVGAGGPTDTQLEVHGFEELCALTPPAASRERAIEKDLAAILYTSGSTGKPKGVMLSHAQVMAGASIVSTYLEITDADRILAVLPFSFDAGMNQLMTAWQQGGTIVLINFVFAREVVQTLIKERVTGLAGRADLLEPDRRSRAPRWPSSRSRTCATSPIPAARCRSRCWPRCASCCRRRGSSSCTGSPRRSARPTCRPRSSTSGRRRWARPSRTPRSW